MTGAWRMSVWALPTAGDEGMYANQIDRLASAAGSRPFPPHITVVSTEGDAETAAAAVDEAAAATQAFTVELTRVEDSDERFRCISLAVGGADRLAGLRDTLVARLGESPGSYSPHLSLLYAEIDSHERTHVKQLVDMSLPRRLTIDRVQLVDTGDDDFTRWSVVQTSRLPGGPTPG